MSQVISIGYGNESFSKRSVKLMSFVVTAPFKRELPGRVFKRAGNVQAFPASRHPEINGTLYQDTVEVPEGTLFLIQAQHSSNGLPARDGAFFFRTRPDGPMTIVKASLPADVNALNMGKFLVLQGRGDVISHEEAVETHGLEVTRGFINGFFDAEEIAECFDFAVTDPGVPPPKMQKIALADGTEAVVKSDKRTRRIRIR